MAKKKSNKFGLGSDLTNMSENFFNSISGSTEPQVEIGNTGKIVSGLSTALTTATPQSFSGNTWGSTQEAKNLNKGINAVADAVSLIPGWGAVAGLGIKGVNLLANEIWGSNVNTDAVENTAERMSNIGDAFSSASSTDEISSALSSLKNINLKKSDYGTQGLANHDLDKAVNGLISQRNDLLAALPTAVNNVNKNNMDTLLKGTFAEGGPLVTGDFFNGVNYIGNGGTHEENPNEGVLMGVDPEGTPNLVEEGEVIWNDYVFSKRLKNPETGKSFSEEALKAQKESEERPNDPISRNGLNDSMMKLAQKQEKVREAERIEKSKEFAKGGNLYFDGSELRYLEPLGSLIALGSNVFDTYAPTKVPDVSLPTVSASAIGDRVAYKPVDRNYYSNQLTAQQAATASGIRNSSTPGKFAAMLAADYNAGNQFGNLAFAADKENYQNYLASANFNRGTNQFNAQQALQAASTNASLRGQESQINSQNRRFNSEQDFRNKQLRDAAIGSEIESIFKSIGGIGKEIENRKLLPKEVAYGGSITRKKKKTLTY